MFLAIFDGGDATIYALGATGNDARRAVERRARALDYPTRYFSDIGVACLHPGRAWVYGEADHEGDGTARACFDALLDALAARNEGEAADLAAKLLDLRHGGDTVPAVVTWPPDWQDAHPTAAAIAGRVHGLAASVHAARAAYARALAEMEDALRYLAGQEDDPT